MATYCTLDFTGPSVEPDLLLRIPGTIGIGFPPDGRLSLLVVVVVVVVVDCGITISGVLSVFISLGLGAPCGIEN